MLQIGIRLHDVNTTREKARQTMEERARTAKAEGFSCVHLALSKVIEGTNFDEAAMTEGLAMHIKRVFSQNGLDVAVLGCYLNLAHPDETKLREIQSRYYGHLRVAALAGIGMVGTETGAPNAAYKLDANTHTKEALDTFLHNLEPVVACAEQYGVTLSEEALAALDAQRQADIEQFGEDGYRAEIYKLGLSEAGYERVTRAGALIKEYFEKNAK